MKSNENIKEDYDGIVKDGLFEGHKDHTANSPYAEDCFAINCGGTLTNTVQYNPARYCAFEALDAFENYLLYNDEINMMKTSDNIRHKIDKINILRQAQHKEMYKHPVDEFLDEKVYKQYIDNFAEQMEKSPAKGVKIVLDFHGDEKDRYLHIRTSKILKKKDEKGYESEIADDRIMNCIKYLLQKISECKKHKNINIVCPACFKAQYYAAQGGKKTDFIEEILIPFSREMSKKGKKVIYTSNFSKRHKHGTFLSKHFTPFVNEINEYSIYDDNKQSFINIHPELKEEDKALYEKYVPTKGDRFNILQLRYLKNIIELAIKDEALTLEEGKDLFAKINNAICGVCNPSDVLDELKKKGFSVYLNSEIAKDFSNFLKENRLYDIYGTAEFAQTIREAKKKKNEILFELSKEKDKENIGKKNFTKEDIEKIKQQQEKQMKIELEKAEQEYNNKKENNIDDSHSLSNNWFSPEYTLSTEDEVKKKEDQKDIKKETDTNLNTQKKQKGV